MFYFVVSWKHWRVPKLQRTEEEETNEVSFDVCDDPFVFGTLDVSNLPILITVGQVNGRHVSSLMKIDFFLDERSSHRWYDHCRRFSYFSAVTKEKINLNRKKWEWKMFIFRITYGVKPSSTITYMNKDGGGSLDLLNIRSMAKVCWNFKVLDEK